MSNVALDVFIGLVFIFLLYSLLATIIMEFIAHALHLRPRLLMKALRRMLEDNPREVFGIKTRFTFFDFFSDVKEAIKRYFKPFKDLHFLQRFYYHPTIKYLGESRSSSKPSYMHANNFSQTILQLFRGGPRDASVSELAAIQDYLFREAEQILAAYKKHTPWVLYEKKLRDYLEKQNLSFEEIVKKLESSTKDPLRYRTRKKELEELIAEIKALGSKEELVVFWQNFQPLLRQIKERKISADTLRHFQNLFVDAGNNLARFRLLLERWFEETMERTTGWYKRQTQIILLCLGFGMAVIANVDTIKIYRTLAKDKKVRDQMVSMAVASQERYKVAIDTLRVRRNADTASTTNNDSTIAQTTLLTTGNRVLDSTYQLLQQDMNSAGSVLGLGWCNSDSCKVYQRQMAIRDSLKQALSASDDSSEKNRLKDTINVLSASIKKGYSKFKDPWNGWSLLGWVITALAISLGAPFWFDLLNKLVRLRSAGIKVQPNDRGDGNNVPQSTPSATPVNVNVQSNTGEEAVG